MDRPNGFRIYLSALAISLLPALLSGYLVWQVRTTVYETGGATALNVAKLIANNIENSFDQLDALMISIGRHYVEDLGIGEEPMSRLARRLEQEIADYPFVARLFVADATGRIVLSGGALKIEMKGADVSDRAYFKRAAEGERGLNFVGPFKSRFVDGWVVVLSRRLESANGDFLGVVGCTVPVEAFEKRLAAVDLFPHGVLVLRNAQGAQVARYSLDPTERGAPGDSLISSSLGTLLEHPERDHDFYETLAPQDHVRRLYAYQKLSNAPFFVLAGQPTAILDQSWRPLTIELGLLSIAGMLGSLWIAHSLRSSALSLKDEKTRLEQRVADRTRELVALNHDLVVSNALAEAGCKAKSEFLATMSHEIRTPLNAIMGTTQLLSRSAMDADQRDCVRTLDSAGQNMLVLLSDVLDLSKIEAGQLELSQAPFALSEAIDHVADTFGVSARSKGLTLRVDPLPDDLPMVVGDVMRLGQVLSNLVGNAIKFTSQGAVTISVEALERSDDHIRVRVVVGDSGIGIAEANLAKLFESFVQAEKSIYREFGGTGLGLAISRRLIALMEGEIGVDSVFGQGSAFWFVIPFKTAPRRPASAALPSTHRVEKQLSGVRILVVDDIETNREIVSKLLSSEGALCEAAANGRDAVERLRASPARYDLVLMDIQMPQMDGLEATRMIRHDLGLADLPVIALTAGAMESQRQVALAAGMNSFIAKPFRLKEMVATLRPFLRRDPTLAEDATPSGGA